MVFSDPWQEGLVLVEEADGVDDFAVSNAVLAVGGAAVASGWEHAFWFWFGAFCVLLMIKYYYECSILGNLFWVYGDGWWV